MFPDQVLIAWLVMLRFQHWQQADDEDQTETRLPDPIVEALLERSWLEKLSGSSVEEEDVSVVISDEGLRVCDLNAAEYGIDAFPRVPE